MRETTDIDQGRDDPPRTRPTDETPTSYGGTTGTERTEPGQSLGRVPDPNDAAVDEAGDPAQVADNDRRGREGARPEPDVDTSGTTAQPDTP